MAEIRAIGKLMLRKKNRIDIIDGSYNKYANHDDAEIIPEWFKEDERKHF
jgi:AdoMet-dependent rRNA methyltransferase SPB1